MGWLASWGWFFCYLTWGSSRCCSQGMAGARTFKMAIVSGLSAGEDSWKPGNSVSLFCGFLYMTSLGCLSWQKGLPPLPSRFSRVWLCETPETATHQAPPSLGFSRQEHWSGLLFPSPMRESEKWKWSCSVTSDPQRPHGLQASRLLHPWESTSQARVLEWGASAFY